MERAHVLAKYLAKAIEYDCDELLFENRNGREYIFFHKNGRGFGMVSLKSASDEADRMRQELGHMTRQALTLRHREQDYLLKAKEYESANEPAFHVVIKAC